MREVIAAFTGMAGGEIFSQPLGEPSGEDATILVHSEVGELVDNQIFIGAEVELAGKGFGGIEKEVASDENLSAARVVAASGVYRCSASDKAGLIFAKANDCFFGFGRSPKRDGELFEKKGNALHRLC